MGTGSDNNIYPFCRAMTIQDGLTRQFQDIAKNGKTTNDHLSAMREDNKELVKIIAGKRQVPMTIFLVVVVSMALVHIIDKVYETGTSLKLTPNEVRINRNDSAGENKSEAQGPTHSR